MVDKQHAPTSAGFMCRRTRVAIMASACLVAACATTPPAPLESLVDFVVDGATTRAEVAARLGAPARHLEQERMDIFVLGYLYGLDADRQVTLVPTVNIARPGFSGCASDSDCQLQLILQYDASDRVVRHALR